jgi:hypothetical protein
VVAAVVLTAAFPLQKLGLDSSAVHPAAESAVEVVPLIAEYPAQSLEFAAYEAPVPITLDVGLRLSMLSTFPELTSSMRVAASWRTVFGSVPSGHSRLLWRFPPW